MSKRTEQRLRARIKALEKLNADLYTNSLEERIRNRDSFKVSKNRIVTADMTGSDFPNWLRHDCLAAWAAGGAVVLEQTPDREKTHVMFMRRIYE